MFEPNSEQAIIRATRLARDKRHEFICVEHLLYSLLEEEEITLIVEDCEVDPSGLMSNLENFFQEKMETIPEDIEHDPEQSLGFQRVLQRAILHSQYSSSGSISVGDIFAAIFTEIESHAVFYLKQEGISRLDVLEAISHEEDYSSLDNDSDEEEEIIEFGEKKQKKDPLQEYTVDLIEKAELGEIDPLIGREKEIDRTIHILCRRNKNNPLYVGDQGVGKTALAEGLALRVVAKKVPEKLQKLRIFSLDMGALIAGTRYRGDFEARLKGVLKALDKIDDAVLFIDEIHTVVGAGATSGGSMDAANLLKPLLGKGKLRFMGSTTFEEYKNHFAKDRALARRFLKIDIVEPSKEETLEILKGLKSRFEEHHGVTYSEQALDSTVELSIKYINDKFLPDKAIDVLDESGAVASLKGLKTVEDTLVEKVISGIARVPAETVSSSDKAKLGNLESNLKQFVFGQDEALENVVRAIKRSRAGLGSITKPIGSFLFAGPTGVGKTEVAKQLASSLGLEMIRFDMSEYMEKHSVSRLVGAPPGYVGFEQGGLLTDSVTKNPHCVLLLDEIEKAHPDVFNILLQVMDNASLTDSNGRTASFSNVILIMTSNVGSEDFYGKPIGFSNEEHEVSHKIIEKTFRPEFRNRLDMIVKFGGLNEQTINKVIDKFITEIDTQLLTKNVSLLLTSEARAWIASNGFEPKYGARSLHRLIQRNIKDPLSDELLFGKLQKGGTARIVVKKDKLAIECDAPKAKKTKSKEKQKA